MADNEKPLQTTWSKPVSLQNNDGVLAVIGQTELFRKSLNDAPNKKSSKDDEVKHNQKDKNALSTKGKFEFGMKII